MRDNLRNCCAVQIFGSDNIIAENDEVYKCDSCDRSVHKKCVDLTPEERAHLDGGDPQQKETSTTDDGAAAGEDAAVSPPKPKEKFVLKCSECDRRRIFDVYEDILRKLRECVAHLRACFIISPVLISSHVCIHVSSDESTFLTSARGFISFLGFFKT